MHIREVFYSGVALVLIGAIYQHGYYGGWMLAIGGIIIGCIGLYRFLRMFE